MRAGRPSTGIRGGAWERIQKRASELVQKSDKKITRAEAEAAFRKTLSASYGMLLVTGPTGSGKSTTLYASLREVRARVVVRERETRVRVVERRRAPGDERRDGNESRRPAMVITVVESGFSRTRTGRVRRRNGQNPSSLHLERWRFLSSGSRLSRFRSVVRAFSLSRFWIPPSCRFPKSMTS